MGKTYIDTVKYQIKADFEVDGIVEKPDIVGAIFGQTEGLLGDELELRELQKNGRIGRIEIDAQIRNGKTAGLIIIPSSLDMVETSILGASVEVVDRVGPYEAKITVEKIEDSRNMKRKQVMDRAKNLLKTLISNEIPETRELTDLLRDQVKTAELIEYGEEKLPAGPEIDSSESIIFVEGRADVLNLLKNNILNAIAIGGANVGKTITRLGKEKEVTAFLDGDRGGDLIVKELAAVTDIDYVVKAPDGKEVEELTRKEIIQTLRKKIPLQEFLGLMTEKSERKRFHDFRDNRENRGFRDRNERRYEDRRPEEKRPDFLEKKVEPIVQKPVQSPVQTVQQPAENPGTKPELLAKLKSLEGSLKARILDEKLETIKEVPIREVMQAITESQNAKAVILDGIVTQRLVDLSEQKGLKYIGGVRSGTITRKSSVSIILSSE
ncbi:MAG: DNA primase DnaG [Candidatus Marsarchaeota archaeon]|nr:DNA primase DnaG [Candidatus Marsarchaeota archaeon]